MEAYAYYRAEICLKSINMRLGRNTCFQLQQQYNSVTILQTVSLVLVMTSTLECSLEKLHIMI
jgi:hypothetical protein